MLQIKKNLPPPIVRQRRSLINTYGRFGDAVNYTQTPKHSLQRTLAALDLDSTSIFCDIGCGKGYVLEEIMKLGIKKVVGVEYNSTFANAAKLALHTTKQESQRVTDYQIIESDAADFQIPRDVTHLYLYLPFRSKTNIAFINQLRRSIRINPRNIQIAYQSIPKFLENILEPLRSSQNTDRVQNKIYRFNPANLKNQDFIGRATYTDTHNKLNTNLTETIKSLTNTIITINELAYELSFAEKLRFSSIVTRSNGDKYAELHLKRNGFTSIGPVLRLIETNGSVRIGILKQAKVIIFEKFSPINEDNMDYNTYSIRLSSDQQRLLEKTSLFNSEKS